MTAPIGAVLLALAVAGVFGIALWAILTPARASEVEP